MASQLKIDYAQAESSIGEMKNINFDIESVHEKMGATMNALAGCFYGEASDAYQEYYRTIVDQNLRDLTSMVEQFANQMSQIVAFFKAHDAKLASMVHNI
ncbi:MAG: WXG100 family type VII secretion target [Eubacterium sp.]|nr:WXG100 family type VII secretion target [Eubacterium sp.]